MNVAHRRINNLPPERVTERTNPAANSLDTRTAREILVLMNREDRKVPAAVAKAIPQIARAVDLAVAAITKGGRLIYLGAGTSGRLGVLDASECRPTFGTDRILAVLAGGPKAMFKSVEGAEDDRAAARKDLRRIRLNDKDVLVGIAASGRTPYTLEGLRYARQKGAATVAVTANPGSPMREFADVEIAVNVGPEIIAGSTRLKAGTAQKLILNMLSTATMVRLGRVFSGLMVHMEMTNEKLRERGRSIIVKATGADPATAARALAASKWNLPAAILLILKNISKAQALRILKQRPNTAQVLRQAQLEYLKGNSGGIRRHVFRGTR
ncbi:MAG TPA: N-acetylmuramic acid 6-phosphate etherase [Terriglobia bacterium]|nr:N-acetylmuramic acid 6-phosphate etherase [Terriglobia bacterium]